MTHPPGLPPVSCDTRIRAAATALVVQRRRQYFAACAVPQGTKVVNDCPIRRAFEIRINAGYAPRRNRVAQWLVTDRVRPSEPRLKEADPQHALQRDRRCACNLAVQQVRSLACHRASTGHGMSRFMSVRNDARRMALSGFSKFRRSRLRHHNRRPNAKAGHTIRVAGRADVRAEIG